MAMIYRSFSDNDDNTLEQLICVLRCIKHFLFGPSDARKQVGGKIKEETTK